MSEDKNNLSVVGDNGSQQPTYYDPRGRQYSYNPQYAFQGNNPVGDDDIDLLALFGALYQRKFLILASMIVAAVVGVFVILQSTPLYRATATIEVQKQESQIVEGASLEPAIIADDEFMETQYALLKSRSLAERVVLLLRLENEADFVEQTLTRDRRVQDAADKVIENLVVEPAGRSRVIKVSFIDPSPERSADVPNVLIDNFIESTLERKFNTTAYARGFLEERLAQAKVTLEESERRLVTYADENDILELRDAGQRTNLANNSLLRLNSDLAEAQSERIIAEQAYLALSNNAVTQETQSSEDLIRLRATRSELEAEYRDLLGTYKPDYPDMVKLNARIDAIEREIENETRAIVNAAQSRFRAARSREDIILTEIEILKQDLRGLRNRSVDYTILQREVDTARSQYDALLQRLKEVSIASGVGSSQISIVDGAIRPLEPFAPNIPLVIALSLLIGAALGIGLSLLLNLLDDTIKAPDDVKNKLKLAVLGVVPKLKSNTQENLIMDELNDPRSVISEAYFSARTALEFSSDTGIPKSVLVTSTQPEEGKTSSTAAVATAFARVGKRVLIIDADMRKPSFVADMETSVGLSGLLTQDHSLEDNIMSSSTKGLYLLPSGVIPPNPAQLLSGQRVRDLIAEAENLFDVVMVDAPPMLNFTDASVLSASCKGTLFVIKSGANRTPAAIRAVERLRESRGQILGAILTQFDAKKSGYGNNYNYYAYGAAATEYGAKSLGNKSSNASRKIRLGFEDPE